MKAAHVFAGITAGNAYDFGIDREKAATALHQMAEEILAGTVAIESARVITLARSDDYVRSILRLVFIDRKLR